MPVPAFNRCNKSETNLETKDKDFARQTLQQPKIAPSHQ